MVENHKDEIFQQKAEKEAIRLKKSRKLNHTKDKEELDQLHAYVHARILQQMGLEDKNIIGFRNDQKNDGEDQQHMAGEEQENGGTND
eukprot:16220741-Heterocapsa_arctica.AAC.1